MFSALLLVSAVFLNPRQSTTFSYAQPPQSIVICGIQDHPCVTYAVSYHPPTHSYGNSKGEGVTDYERKTISIAWCSDHFKNVEALEHEVFHAALWERGFHDTDKWEIHDWIYFSEGAFPLLFHDNPEFVKYLSAGY
jgi:hypothetical protein